MTTQVSFVSIRLTVLPAFFKGAVLFFTTMKKFKKILPLIILGVIVLVAVVIAGAGISKAFKKSNTAVDPRIVITDAKATQKINKDYSYPINDKDGKVATQLKLHIDTIEKRDEIIVNGARATSVKGRTFLVVSIKIDNNTYNNPLQVNVGDYFRLTMNGKDSEFLATDINSDPVMIQAASTKTTRVGFAVNDSDKKLKLWVGEIKGAKQEIDLSI